MFEFGRLKRTERSGWSMARVQGRVESVADHTCRTALIAFFLATLEGADPRKAAVMALFHDVSETRVGDLDMVAKGYVANGDEAEDAALVSQFGDDVPGGKEIRDLVHEFNGRDSIEARVVKDADIIECEIQAREYETNAFLESVMSNGQVRCQSSLKLLEAIRNVSPDQWWKESQCRDHNT
jgi:putative hydrolase of HD superfamily